MNPALRWAGVAGVGAGIMYFLDPDRGRRRRAMARDKGTSVMHQTRWAAGKTWRDVSHRAQGLAATGRNLVSRSGQESDDGTVEARVRTALGRATSHAGALNVSVSNGRVRLDGAVLEHEHARVISAARSARGVVDVEEHLHRYASAEGAPSLQGGARRTASRIELMQENWAPAARALVGGAGLGMLVWGLKSRSAGSLLAGAAGAAMLARAVSNRNIREIARVARRQGIDVQKALRINAPIEEVYRFWTNYGNFPTFMRNIREVRDLGNGRSRWTAAGPAGVPASWDAQITERVENRLLAWKSLPGSAIENAGIVRFERDGDSTRVTVRMSYHPPAGQLGHTVASLFGTDPKSEMDEDLGRMKSTIEQSRTAAGGRTGPERI